MADLSNQIQEAKKAGYSDDEIASFLGKSDPTLAPKITQAKSAGYGSADILAHLSTAAPAPAKPAPKPTAKAKPSNSLLDYASGMMANVNRGSGIGDELAAGFNTATNVLSGKVQGQGLMGSLNAIGDDYKNSLAHQRQIEDTFTQEHPHVAALSRGTGMAGTMAVPGGSAAQTFAQGGRVANALRGATTAGLTGAAYAAADRGTVDERLKAATDTAKSPLALGLGAAFGAASGGARPTNALAPKVAAKPSDGQILADIGVSTSIPQRMGRTAKALEDLTKRFPILGQAVSSYTDRQIGQLNRGVALTALEPVGLSLPKDIKPGFEMVEHVDDALGSIYSQAADMVPAVPHEAIQALQGDLLQIGARKADLAETTAAQFDKIIENRLTRLAAPGAATGALVKKIHGELGALQAEAARKGETTLSGMLADSRQALMSVIAKSNPEAAALIKKADKGWQIYSIMNDAAAAANNRGGIFLPGQLNSQVRSAGRGMGSNMTGKGKAPLQDIATAASRTLPDSYGNPGTANALLLGSGGVGLATAPVQTIATGAALAAAATPYLLAGRKIIETLPNSATRRELERAAADLARLAANDPKVADLQRIVAARLGRSAGMAGANAEPSRGRQPNALAISPR